MSCGPIVVAAAADAAYALPLAVLLKSLVASLDPAWSVALFAVDGGIAPDDRKRIEDSCDPARITFHWQPRGTLGLDTLPVWGRMNEMTYERLLLDCWLPAGCRRALWLDCDTVVVSDLSRLWNSDLDGGVLAAVQDLVVPYVSSRFGIAGYRALGLAANAPYFNAGVMLVDVDRWREEGVARRAFDYLARAKGDVFFWDQEALNVAIAGRWTCLDPRWNQIASVCGRRFFRPQHLDPASYAALVSDPWIVHYAGSLKPWTLARHRDERFQQWVDATPFRGWRPPTTPRARLLGAYDRLLRDHLYRAEVRAFELLRPRRLFGRRPSD